MQAAGTRGQRPRSQEASAGCFPAVHPQCDDKWSGWGQQGRVRPRSETGTLQQGRSEDSPPPPFRKGLADTLLLVHPDPPPLTSRGAVPKSMLLIAPLPPALPPDFCPQSLPFSLDPRKIARDNHSGSSLQDGQQLHSWVLCPCLAPAEGGKWKYSILSQGRGLVSPKSVLTLRLLFSWPSLLIIFLSSNFYSQLAYRQERKSSCEHGGLLERALYTSLGN